MTEERLEQGQRFVAALRQLEELLLPFKWDGSESSQRMAIRDSVKVYAVGRREVCFLTPHTIEKIAMIIWKELKFAEKDLYRDLEKL